MSLITTAWINNKISLINSARSARGFSPLSVSFVIGESITVTDTTTKINTLINATAGTAYTTSPWTLPIRGSKIKQAHFNALDQLATDLTSKTKCKNCGNVCVSTCTTGGCIGGCVGCTSCSGCSACSGCGGACAGGCGSCSGGACWGCGGGCTSCSGCSSCSGCNGCSSCGGCSGCSSSCQAACNTICTNGCNGTCGSGCTTTARLGVIG